MWASQVRIPNPKSQIPLSLRADALACGRLRLLRLRRRRGLRRGGLDVGLLLTGSTLALHVDAAAEVRAFGDRHARRHDVAFHRPVCATAALFTRLVGGP